MKLDTRPKGVLGLRLHEGAAPSSQEIVNLLKDAYLNKQTVTIMHTSPPGKDNVEIVWVQLGEDGGM